MIENLSGIHETVNYKDNTNVKIHDNTDFEEYPNHWHTPVEIIMPVENHYIVEYSGSRYILEEGDIIFICPGVLHHLPAVRGRRYIVQAEFSSIFAIQQVESVITMISPALIITPRTFPDICDHVRSLILDIVEEYKQRPPLYEAGIYSRLLDMITSIARSPNNPGPRFESSRSKQWEYMEKFSGICAYISSHCTENLTLDQMADLSGFSKYHFTRLFKQYTHVSFYRYLNQRRILKAEKLLINPAANVTNVALSCGFSSLSAFIRMFKIIKGCTPSEFRSMYEAPPNGDYCPINTDSGPNIPQPLSP